jgi:orotidine-5'-phosphate decarboxylase
VSANPVYLAIDTADLDHALALARAVKPHVGGVKLGMEFFYAQGPQGVARIADLGLPLFLDLKLHDIPNTVAGGLTSLAQLKPAILNVHAQGGRAMLRAGAEAARAVSPHTKLIAVTVLTSLDGNDLADLGIAAPDPAAQAERMAALARAAGLDGVVCSAHEVGALRASWPNGMFVVPGVRPSGADIGDQKRVMTPQDALAAGASVLVIGRPITAAPDPAAAAEAIARSLSSR